MNSTAQTDVHHITIEDDTLNPSQNEDILASILSINSLEILSQETVDNK